MPVQNLGPGAVTNVAPGQIQGNVHVYRTSDGYAGPGNVGWLPNAGNLQMQQLDNIGYTVTFAINGAAGQLANACPSKVQLLWENNVAAEAPGTIPNAALSILQKTHALTASPNTAKQVMDMLTAQWYNAVVTACHLDSSTFQLFQGNSSVGLTSQNLWKIFDVVPPLSASNYYNPSQANVFSLDYGGVINNLKPQNANAFTSAMGDYYSIWLKYLSTNPSIPQGGIIELFHNWSQLNMPPDKAQSCYTIWQQVAQGVVPVAVQMWLNSGGATGVKAYNATIDDLQTALLSAQPASIQMNSATASGDVSQTWAQGKVEGAYDFFTGEANASYNQLTTALYAASVTITASFQRLLTFPAAPLAHPSSDPILSQYQPWYNSSALSLAYHHQDNNVWNNTPPTWSETFGPTGNMLRTCSALVIVDGIDIKMTSNVKFSSTQQTAFQAGAQVGFWPFFAVSGSGGWRNDVSFDDSGNMTVASQCSTGNPSILGAIVTPVGGALLLS